MMDEFSGLFPRCDWPNFYLQPDPWDVDYWGMFLGSTRRILRLSNA